MTTTRKPKKPPSPLEKTVQKACLALLEHQGIPHMRLNAGGSFRPGRGGKPQLIRHAPKGWGDTIGWLPGSFGWAAGKALMVEYKRVGKRPSDEQFAVLRRVIADGGIAVWVNDVKQLERVLDGVREGKRVELNSEGMPYLTDEPREETT